MRADMPTLSILAGKLIVLYFSLRIATQHLFRPCETIGVRITMDIVWIGCAGVDVTRMRRMMSDAS